MDRRVFHPSLKELNLYFNIMNVKLCLLNQEMPKTTINTKNSVITTIDTNNSIISTISTKSSNTTNPARRSALHVEVRESGQKN